MRNNQKVFGENEIKINSIKCKYYLSPILLKNNFEHGFFTKKCAQFDLSTLSSCINLNQNSSLKQIHSNKIVFASKAKDGSRVEADGIMCDESKQNLWIYSADCMPILFADRKKRLVAAIHCGRKGLEKKIIKNIIKIFDNFGTSKENLLVAIGPSISKKNYSIDKNTFQEFYKEIHNEESNSFSNLWITDYLKNLIQFKNIPSIPLDLKHCAHTQLLNENIPNSNIDISTLCTYESTDDFYSWRRSKTSLRQWSFIST